MSGLVKNALDYAEDLRSDARGYFDGIAVGCIACGAGCHAAVQTLSCLRTVAHCLRGWPTPYGAALNTAQKLFDATGNCVDPAVKFQLEMIAIRVCEFAQARACRA
jgi:FMN reductase